MLILNDFKSFEPEVLILGDFKSLFPEVLILVDLKSLIISEMQKIEKILEVLIVEELAEIAMRGGLILHDLRRRHERLIRIRFREYTLKYSISAKACQCVLIRYSDKIGYGRQGPHRLNLRGHCTPPRPNLQIPRCVSICEQARGRRVLSGPNKKAVRRISFNVWSVPKPRK